MSLFHLPLRTRPLVLIRRVVTLGAMLALAPIPSGRVAGAYVPLTSAGERPLHARAVPATAVLPPALVRFFSGSWRCRGSDARGRSVASRLEVRPAAGGTWLAVAQDDDPPGRYHALALWGPTAADSIVATVVDNTGATRRFVGGAWTGGTLVLARDTLIQRRRSGERFRYSKMTDALFEVTYDVLLDSAWRLGDRLVCARTSSVTEVRLPAAPADGTCTRALPDVPAAEWIRRAERAVGMDRANGRVLHYTASDSRELADQSDRSYPPFLALTSSRDVWLDPATGVQRFPRGRGYALRGPRGTEQASDSLGGVAAQRPAPTLHAQLGETRAFDVWATIADWERATDARVVGLCQYLDYDRVVLSRRGALGDERLYLDSATGFPLKLARTELHYYLGPVHAEYVYSAWVNVEPRIYIPVSAIRLTDGLGQENWTIFPLTRVGLVERDSAPALRLADSARSMSSLLPPLLGADAAPDTERVGRHTFLLRNASFTSAVTMVRDTVFILDAPQGEGRARQDSLWIGRLFPGHHPVVLILPVSAWPHTAGMRFWAATGARIIAHRVALPAILQALHCSWREYPDALEREHRDVTAQVVALDDSLSLAGGALRLYAIRGIGSEGSFLAYLGDDQFLWASDRVQDVETPSLYTTELLRAAADAGLSPRLTSGPHFGVVEWSRLDRLREQQGPKR